MHADIAEKLNREFPSNLTNVLLMVQRGEYEVQRSERNGPRRKPLTGIFGWDLFHGPSAERTIYVPIFNLEDRYGRHVPLHR